MPKHNATLATRHGRRQLSAAQAGTNSPTRYTVTQQTNQLAIPSTSYKPNTFDVYLDAVPRLDGSHDFVVLKALQHVGEPRILAVRHVVFTGAPGVQTTGGEGKKTQAQTETA